MDFNKLFESCRQAGGSADDDNEVNDQLKRLGNAVDLVSVNGTKMHITFDVELEKYVLKRDKSDCKSFNPWTLGTPLVLTGDTLTWVVSSSEKYAEENDETVNRLFFLTDGPQFIYMSGNIVHGWPLF